MSFDSKRRSRSLTLLWFALVLFLVFSVIFPLACVVCSVRPKDFADAFLSANLLGTLQNTFVECISSTTLSVLIGFLYAYAVVKADIPFRKFFAAIPLVHLITPPFVGGLAFILLLGRKGLITHTLLGLDVSLYGFWGLLIAQTLCFFPMAYLICMQTLMNLNRNVEMAAVSMGASRLRIFFTVTLPLCLNGIVSSFLFIAVSVLSDFGNPLIVGGRFKVLAVEIYSQLTGWLNVGTSCVLGIVLVLPSLILFFAQRKIAVKTSSRLSFTSIGADVSNGRGNSSRASRIIFTVFVSFVTLCVLLQFASIVAGSFQKLWGVDSAFTLNHMKSVSKYAREIGNSLLFAFISAVLSTFIALVSGYVVHRTNMPLKKTIDVFSQISSAIPGSLLGLSISVAANILHIRNSALLIITAMTVSFMPFAYRIISSSYTQIKTTLDDAGTVLGANKIKVLFTVLVPLCKGGIFSGFTYDFMRGVGTLSSVIFLVSFKTPLASIKIVNLAEQGDWGKACALALVLTAVTFAILLLSRLFSGEKNGK